MQPRPIVENGQVIVGTMTTLGLSVDHRVTAGAGYADIDPRYPPLNADRFMRGKRAYVTASARITRVLTAQFFGTQAVRNGFAVSNARRFDACPSAWSQPRLRQGERLVDPLLAARQRLDEHRQIDNARRNGQ